MGVNQWSTERVTLNRLPRPLQGNEWFMILILNKKGTGTQIVIMMWLLQRRKFQSDTSTLFLMKQMCLQNKEVRIYLSIPMLYTSRKESFGVYRYYHNSLSIIWLRSISHYYALIRKRINQLNFLLKWSRLVVIWIKMKVHHFHNIFTMILNFQIIQFWTYCHIRDMRFWRIWHILVKFRQISL